MQERLRRTMPKVVRNAAGILLILLGIVGLFLPFLQGLLFLVVGVGLLDFEKKTQILARARRRLKGWVPRRWMYPSRERRARRVARIEARRKRRGKPLDGLEPVD